MNKYINEAKLHKQAIWSISQDPLVQEPDKEKLLSAYQYGKWLSFGLQFPGIWGGAIMINRKISKLPTDKKFVSYLVGIFVYLNFYSITTAFAWHQAYFKAEDSIKSFVVSKTSESLPLEPIVKT